MYIHDYPREQDTATGPIFKKRQERRVIGDEAVGNGPLREKHRGAAAARALILFGRR